MFGTSIWLQPHSTCGIGLGIDLPFQIAFPATKQCVTGGMDLRSIFGQCPNLAESAEYTRCFALDASKGSRDRPQTKRPVTLNDGYWLAKSFDFSFRAWFSLCIWSTICTEVSAGSGEVRRALWTYSPCPEDEVGSYEYVPGSVERCEGILLRPSRPWKARRYGWIGHAPSLLGRAQKLTKSLFQIEHLNFPMPLILPNMQGPRSFRKRANTDRDEGLGLRTAQWAPSPA